MPLFHRSTLALLENAQNVNWRQFGKFMKNFWQIFMRGICRVNILQLTKWWCHPEAVGHSRFICRKSFTKYCTKVYGLVDVTSNCILNFEIYAGQQPEGNFRTSNLLTDVIVQMIDDPIRSSGRTITMGNYFTLLLVFRVIKEKHVLQAVGTVNKNRTFIPPLFLATKIICQTKIDGCYRLFGFSNTGTLVSYCSPTKCVTILFSTLDQHKNERLDEDVVKMRPQFFQFYNHSKGEVDTSTRCVVNTPQLVSVDIGHWQYFLRCWILEE